MSSRPKAQTARAGFANVVGFDDAPFPHAHAGDVRVFGAVYADERVVGVLTTVVRREAIERTLLGHVPGGARKWALIQQAGRMEPCGEIFVQRAGLSLAEAHATVLRHSREGNLPEPLRVAHLIAGGVTDGESRGRA